MEIAKIYFFYASYETSIEYFQALIRYKLLPVNNISKIFASLLSDLLFPTTSRALPCTAYHYTVLNFIILQTVSLQATQ